MKKYFTLLAILSFTVHLAWAGNYYVNANTGNDGNAGTSTQSPFKTIQRAADLAVAGDVVYVMDGVYKNTCEYCEIIKLTKSGTPTQPITFKNYPGHSPLIEFTSYQAILMRDGASYIVLDGLKVKGARSLITLEDALKQPGGCNSSGGSKYSEPYYNGNGLLAVGPGLWGLGSTAAPHHITVQNCEFFDCTSSGMAFQRTDYITLKNNKVYNNCWYTKWGTSGINFYQSINIDSDKGTHNIIEGNRVWGNKLLVDSQGSSCLKYDGNGIIIDNLIHSQLGSPYPSYAARTLVRNNLVKENGGSGIHVFTSNYVDVINNTFIGNGAVRYNTDVNAEVHFANAIDIVCLNNILISQNRVVWSRNVQQLTYSNNLQIGPKSDISVCSSCISTTPSFASTDIVSATAYQLKAGSAGIDAGTSTSKVPTDILGVTRPKGTAYDIGAYEYNSGGSGPVYNTIIVPNPVLGTLSPRGDNLVGATLKVFDAAGVERLSSVARFATPNLNVSTLPAGQYTLRISRTDGTVETVRFQKS